MNEVETKIKRNNLLKELLSACEQAGLTPFVTENPTDAGSIENPLIALARLAPLLIKNIPLTDDMTQQMKIKKTEKQNERMRENNLRKQPFQIRYVRSGRPSPMPSPARSKSTARPSLARSSASTR